jgi:hypothetical protein
VRKIIRRSKPLSFLMFSDFDRQRGHIWMRANLLVDHRQYYLKIT